MKNVKERKTQVRRKVETNNKKYAAQKKSVKRKKKVKLRKGRVALAVGLALYGTLSIFNYFTFNDFEAKTLDYALEFPVQEEYHNVILETEKCSVIEKLSVGRLSRQKEAPILCTNQDEVPRVTKYHLDEFKNVYVVGDINGELAMKLNAMGLNVKQYRGWLGFIKTLY